jgi:hypothetical protein
VRLVAGDEADPAREAPQRRLLRLVAEAAGAQALKRLGDAGEKLALAGRAQSVEVEAQLPLRPAEVRLNEGAVLERAREPARDPRSLLAPDHAGEVVSPSAIVR